MLQRSRSWPVQSVITLDPRGIIYAEVQPPGEKTAAKFPPASTVSQIRDPRSKAKPDVVLETDDRIRLPANPDIFFTLGHKAATGSTREQPMGKKVEGDTQHPIEITFVDHYQVLDSAFEEQEKQGFVMPVPSNENLKWKSKKVPLKSDAGALRNSYGVYFADDPVEGVSALPVSTGAESEKCKRCRTREIVQRNRSRWGKTLDEEKEEEEEGETQEKPNGVNQFLTNYQIDLLRKNCLKSLNRLRSVGSIDINSSLDRDSGGKPGQKMFERKLTSDFESVASNETKTTDCDGDKCGVLRKRGKHEDKSTASFHLIRSYSLGHEQTREKITGTFKKFSLPTPIIQLKGENENPENAQEEGDSALQNLKLDKRKVTTLTRHYYPENGWGYVIVTCSVMVHILCHGLQLAAGVIMVPAALKFGTSHVHTGWLGALSTAVALFLSPITIAFCRRKSTRVTAVVGGLITALGCLFTSFASQFHQLFFSYGTVIGVGVSLTRDCSTLMVAQYFKRRRELVEIFIVSGSGLGITIMSVCIQGAINAIGWRLGLQAITGAIFLTFILGTFYRSASLYHPQRRAILHLKNQKRKIKDKNKSEEKPAFLDMTALRSKTVRILLASTGLSAFGINTPIFYLARQAEQEGLGERAVFLQAYLGLAWVLGCAAFGLVVVHNSVECRIARQYLCQAAVFMCGLSILALTAVHGNYHGYVLFVWIYGIFCGGYHYSLKMYTYEKVRARNFARTWGFVQCSQAIPIALGVPISGYMNEGCGGKAGYYFSSTFTLAGSLAMFLIDVHRRRIARHKHTKANGQRHLCESDSCPRRRPSFGAEPEPEPPIGELPMADLVPVGPGEKPELTCISEEGIADMDLPDNLLDELDYIGITSCNKVENYLMLSEFENNLIAETPVLMDKRGRRWSLAKRPDDQLEDGNKWRLVPPKRKITVIDEASV